MNATVLLDTAHALVSTGLAKLGWEYVNSDGALPSLDPGRCLPSFPPRSRLAPGQCSLWHRNQSHSLLVMTDCWMLLNRSADGRQIPNPAKFPDGFKAVADVIQ